MPTQNMQLRGLTCGACAKLSGLRLKHIPDVTNVEVQASGAVTLTANRVIQTAEVQAALTGTPYSLVETPDNTL